MMRAASDSELRSAERVWSAQLAARMSVRLDGRSNLPGSVSGWVPASAAALYMVTHGTADVDRDHATEPVRLDAGDLIVLVGDGQHVLRDRRTRPAQDRAAPDASGSALTGANDTEQEPARATSARIFGGIVWLSDDLRWLLMPTGQGFLVLRSAQLRDTLAGMCADRLIAEAHATDPAAPAVTDLLVGLLLLDVTRLRARDNTPAAVGPRPESDASIAPVVTLLNTQPQAAWTLERMADEAGLARTQFVARFRDVVGTTPAAYLRNRRLSLAEQMLHTTRLPIHEIARRVGYASAGALCTAIQRKHGVGPGEIRTRAQRAGAEAPIPSIGLAQDSSQRAALTPQPKSEPALMS